MTLLKRFSYYLLSQNFKPNTIKNYLADIRKFLNFLKEKHLAFNEQFIPLSSFLVYQKFLLKSSLSQPVLKRYFSSLNQFKKFLNLKASEDNKNYQNNDKTPQNLEEQLLEAFAQELEKEKLSKTTIINYLVDIKQFLNWKIISSPGKTR